eukprot:1196824-Rhodomonas_salina.2
MPYLTLPRDTPRPVLAPPSPYAALCIVWYCLVLRWGTSQSLALRSASGTEAGDCGTSAWYGGRGLWYESLVLMWVLWYQGLNQLEKAADQMQASLK